ncbi:MAG: hypothetical protein V3R95_08670 [Dehalococcoidia bacterium]
MSERANGSRALSWLGGVVIVVATGAIATLAVVVLFGGDGDGGGAPRGAVLNREVTLRSSPDAASGALATLDGGVPIVVTARSADGEWVAIEVEGRGFVGWAPADAIEDLTVATQPAEATGTAQPPGGASPTATAAGPTQTPDYPDLVVEAVYSRDNRLVVAIKNIGDADVAGAVFVIVDGGEPVQQSVGGKPLRPGETLEAVLEDEYVQRRGAVTVEVRLAEGIEENSLDNNRLEVVLSPDVPNDLELSALALDPETAMLTVTVRNNSIIPIVGVATIAVRRTAPSSTLIARFDAPLNVAAGGTQQYEYPLEVDGELPEAADLLVILASDAINDAVEANNTFPR